MAEIDFINLAEQRLKEAIRKKINYKEIPYENEEEVLGIRDTARKVAIHYDGFDMSGYYDAHYTNLQLISRFKNYQYLINKEEIKEDGGTQPERPEETL